MVYIFLILIYCHFSFNVYTVDSPFDEYCYWPRNPGNRDARENSSYVQFIWATVYWISYPRNGKDP